MKRNGIPFSQIRFSIFHDVPFFSSGIRNAVVGMFNPLNLRDDAGRIWENYIMSEMQKHREYQRRSSMFYFWRTYDKKEIDLVVDEGGNLSGYEIKWKQNRVAPPKDWSENYPQATFQVLHRDNYLNYIQ